MLFTQTYYSYNFFLVNFLLFYFLLLTNDLYKKGYLIN